MWYISRNRRIDLNIPVVARGLIILTGIVGLALIGTATLGWPAQATTLNVTIGDVKAGPGSVRVALYSDTASFRHEERAFRVLSAPASMNPLKFAFVDIPAGRYAVLVYHDANDDKKLNLTLGMFPNEGWGLSNNPKIIGPPSFSASAFSISDADRDISVTLHY